MYSLLLMVLLLMVFIVLPNLLFVFYIYTFAKSFMIYLSVYINFQSINQCMI